MVHKQNPVHGLFLYIACELIKAFYIFEQLFKKKRKEYVTATVCVPQSLKYLLSDSFQKNIADP